MGMVMAKKTKQVKAAKRAVVSAGGAAEGVSLRDWVLATAQTKLGERRWGAGRTDRRNVSQFEGATDATLNEDLDQYLARLRQRCTLEIANNDLLEGAIDSWITDVLGDHGPRLQLSGLGRRPSREIEQAWGDFWRRADASGASGYEHMAVSMRSLCSHGDFLTQFSLASAADLSEDPTGFRLAAIDTRALKTPWVADGDIVMGVEISGRRPVRYHVEQYARWGPNLMPTGKFETLSASEVIHGFLRREPGQVRGVPMVASVLPASANCRRYEEAVIDAATLAALYAAVLETESPDAPFVPVSGTSPLDLEPFSITAMPPGYKMKQMVSNQPTQQYVSFRHENVRAYGVPFGMPLHRVLKDASKMNYSSQRGDSKDYFRHRSRFRAWLARVLLEPVFQRWLREYELRRARALRGVVRASWTWPAEEYVDPLKEAAGAQVALQTGVKTFQEACAERGLDWEEVLSQLAVEKAAFEAQGMAHPSAGQLTDLVTSLALAGEGKVEEVAGG